MEVGALREKAAALPEAAGCYLFRSTGGRVIYVGKAKALRRRVLSYFRSGEAETPKVQAILKDATDLEVILTGTEVEALILENSLVKRHRPRYNVLLRDDKNFPYLKLTTGEPFPRVILVRRPLLDDLQSHSPPFLLAFPIAPSLSGDPLAYYPCKNSRNQSYCPVGLRIAFPHKPVTRSFEKALVLVLVEVGVNPTPTPMLDFRICCRNLPRAASSARRSLLNFV